VTQIKVLIPEVDSLTNIDGGNQNHQALGLKSELLAIITESPAG